MTLLTRTSSASNAQPDAPFEIPNLTQSLRARCLKGGLSVAEAAEVLCQTGWMNSLNLKRAAELLELPTDFPARFKTMTGQEAYEEDVRRSRRTDRPTWADLPFESQKQWNSRPVPRVWGRTWTPSGQLTWGVVAVPESFC